MCGIAGIAALSPVAVRVDEPAVRRMLPPLRHRGPDGSGVYLDPCGKVGLGHTRLSIIDLEGARSRCLTKIEAFGYRSTAKSSIIWNCAKFW